MMIALALLAPLVFALAIAVSGTLPSSLRGRARRAVTVLAPLCAVPAAALALDGAAETLELPWLLMGSVLRLDGVARPLVLVAAVLYGTALAAVAWTGRGTRGASPLAGFLLVGFAGNIGTYLAADAVTFYLAFAVMSFSAAGLVVHDRSTRAHRATTVYLVMSVLSETAILAALLLLVSGGGMRLDDAPSAAASSHPVLISGLLLLGLGVKAGTVPLHVWLPLAHPAAPPAASAVLSGAMVKAGMVGWIRFLPDGSQNAAAGETAGTVLLVLSLIGALAAALVGVLQDDPKVVLAYSTISQMGFIGAVVAAGLLEPGLRPAATAAAVVYACHHGLAKGALFLSVPVIGRYGGRTVLGAAVAAGTALAALAIAGAPLTTGALGKYIAKDVAESITLFGVGLDALLTLVATGSTLLLIRFAMLLARSEKQGSTRLDGALAVWWLLIAAALLVPWVITDRCTPAPLPQRSAYTVWTAAWPILLGVLIGVLVLALLRGQLLPASTPRADGSSIPPGDLIEPATASLRRASRVAERGAARVDRAWAQAARATEHAGSRLLGTVRRALGRSDDALGRWEISGMVTLMLLGAVTTVAALAQVVVA